MRTSVTLTYNEERQAWAVAVNGADSAKDAASAFDSAIRVMVKASEGFGRHIALPKGDGYEIIVTLPETESNRHLQHGIDEVDPGEVLRGMMGMRKKKKED